MDSELPTGLSTALLVAGYPQDPQLRRRFARLNATMEFARFNATKSVHLLWQVRVVRGLRRTSDAPIVYVVTPEDLDYFLRYLDENWPRVRAYINEKYKDW